MSDAWQPVAGTAPSLYVAPSAAPETATDGGVRSIRIPASVPVAQFGVGARSHTDADSATRFEPSPVTTVSGGGVAMPDSSVAVQRTVTLPAYQPLAFGLVTRAPVTTGGVLSAVPSTTASPPGSVIRPSATPSASPIPPSVSVTSTRSGCTCTRPAGSSDQPSSSSYFA